MIHVDGLHCAVTGPAARVPARWDPRPSFQKLVRRGLVDLSDLHPISARAIEEALQERMRRYPLYCDSTIAVTSTPLPSDAVTTFDEHRAHPIAILVDRARRSDVDPLRTAAADMASGASTGLHAPTSRPLSYPLLHEAAHMVVTVLRQVPGVEREIERRVGMALGVGAYRLQDPSPQARLELAAQLGWFAIGDTGDDGAVDLVEEQGADAIALALEYGGNAPPVSAAWSSVADLCLGPTSPCAWAINSTLHEHLRRARHRDRTAPQRARTPQRWTGSATILRALETDEDLAWELRHPEAGPDGRHPWGTLVKGLRRTGPSTSPPEHPDRPQFDRQLVRDIHARLAANPLRLADLARGDTYSGITMRRRGTAVVVQPAVDRPRPLDRPAPDHMRHHPAARTGADDPLLRALKEQSPQQRDGARTGAER